MSYAYVATFTGNLASFACGTLLTWPSPVLDKLRNSTETPFSEALSKDTATWVSAFLPLGAIFGPFLYGFLSDRIGRKLSVLSLGIPFAIGLLIMTFAEQVWMYLLARLLCGLATGGLFGIFPNYVGEVADAHNRGALSSSLNVFLCAGMLVSYSLGPYVSVQAFNGVLVAFPAVFLCLFLIFGPETAYFHMMKNNHDEAKKCLEKVRSKDANVEEELATLKKKIAESSGGNFWLSLWNHDKGITKAFIISVGLVVLQQFSGINAVLFYAQKIFQDAGVSLDPQICSILVGVVQFATSFVTPLLVDRLGRKMLLYISAVGMVITEAPIAVYGFLQDAGKDVDSIAFIPIASLIGYMITYSVGFGPLPWTVAGEMFPSSVKATASSAVAAICWFFGFLIAKYFEAVKDALGMGPVFLIFTLACAVAIPFLYFVVLETKGKSLHEIQEELAR